MSKRMWCGLVAAVAVAAVWAALPAAATTYYYNVSSGTWTNPAAWTPAGFPTSYGSDPAYIGHASGVADGTVLISWTNLSQHLELGVGSGKKGTITLGDTSDYLVAGNLAGDNFYVGNGGIGVVNMNNGWLRGGNNLYVGSSGTGSGLVSQASGVLTMRSQEFIGDNGVGTYNQSGGYNFAPNSIYLGFTAGKTGTITISGGKMGSLDQLRIGESGSGTVTQSGGNVGSGSNLPLGVNVGSSGTYTLSGGNLFASGEVYVGGSGSGTFNQSGGDAVFQASLQVPQSSTAGAYTLSGGTLDVQSYVRIGYGSGGGTFNQTGGTLVLGRGTDFRVGESGPGTYTLSSGAVMRDLGGAHMPASSGVGTVVNQGRMTIVGSMGIGQENTAARGTFTMNGAGAELLVGGEAYWGYQGRCNFVQSNGTTRLHSTLHLGENGYATNRVEVQQGEFEVQSNLGVGYRAPSTFVQGDGTRVDGQVYLAEQGTGYGRYLMGTSDPTTRLVNHGECILGYFGTGELVQNAGMNYIGSSLHIGYQNATTTTGRYTLVTGSVLALGDISVGEQGYGSMVQSNGSVTAWGTVRIPYYGLSGQNGRGSYDLQAGSLEAKTGNLQVGSEGSGNGTGSLTQGANARVHTGSSLIVGYNQSGSIGTYTVGAGATVQADSEMFVAHANGSAGTFVQEAGSAVLVRNNLRLAENNGAFGTYTNNGGMLETRRESNNKGISVGEAGQGRFVQNGGSITSAHSIVVGNTGTGNGVMQQNSGTLTLHRGANAWNGIGGSANISGIVVGNSGYGEFDLSSASGQAAIDEFGPGQSLTLRDDVGQTAKLALFKGWGTVGLSGELRNNSGIMRADGYGTERTLDLSSLRSFRMHNDTYRNRFGNVGNRADNTTTNGWFATSKGKLRLPDLFVDFDENGAGRTPLKWGEQYNDETPDLVNSARLEFRNVTAGGDLQGSLLATDRTDIPAGLAGNAIGVWQFVAPGGGAWDGVEATLRYDDAAAAAASLTEANLDLWYYDGTGATGWRNATTGGVDTANHRISGGPLASFTGTVYLAVCDSAGTAFGSAVVGAAPTFDASGGSPVYSATGQWNAGANWSTSARPGDSATAYISNGVVSVDSFNERANNLYLGRDGGVGGTLNLTNALSDLEINTTLYVGDAGSGTVNHSAGRLEVDNNDLRVGRDTTGQGTYNLSGGELVVAQHLALGQKGQGTLNQSGGMLRMYNQTWLGGEGFEYGGSSGTGYGVYNLSSGKFWGDAQFNVGYYGTGVVNQTGGQISINSTMEHAYQPGSRSTYTLTDGSLHVQGEEYMARQGNATFVHSNGYHRAQSNLRLAANSSGVAQYTMDGGVLDARGVLYIGENGRGTVTQRGGHVDVSGAFYAGNNNDSSGTYNLSGSNSALFANSEFYLGDVGTGTFTHVDGRVDIMSSLRLGWNQASASDRSVGRYTMAGTNAFLHVRGIEYIGYLGDGTFIQSNGTHEVGSELNMGEHSQGLTQSRLEVLGGSLTVRGATRLPYYGTGTVIQADGVALDVGNIEMARNAGVGTFTMGTIGGSGATIYNRGSHTVGGSTSSFQDDLTHISTATFAHNSGENRIDGELDIAGSGGSTGTYTMSNGLVAVRSDILVGRGRYSQGTMTQSGTVRANAMALGHRRGASGSYSLNSGSLLLWGALRLADASEGSGTSGTTGTFYQAGGTTNTVFSTVYVARGGGTATYTMDGSGAELSAYADFHVGSSDSGNTDPSTGTFLQNGGSTFVGGQLYVGSHRATDNGTFTLNSGNLWVEQQEYIGNSGAGTFNQNGGTNRLDEHLALGRNSGASGVYNLNAGTLRLASKWDQEGIRVGMAGDGVLNLGASGAATISEIGPGANLKVQTGAGKGTVRGWGTADMSGSLINNGLVIADGYGTAHTLDLASFRRQYFEEGTTPLYMYGNIYNPTDNTTTNGWYATNKGKLKLPPLFVTDSAYSYKWGEQGNDSTIDLVNSVEITFNGLTYGGPLNISLLADDHPDMNGGTGELIGGNWLFEPDPAMRYTSVTLKFRYDENTANAITGGEAALKAYQYAGGTWTQLGGVAVDTLANTVTITGLTSMTGRIALGLDVTAPPNARTGTMYFIN